MRQITLRNLFLVGLLLALCACAAGTKLQPPAASIQQMRVLPDGQWQLTLRVENYSYDTAMHVYTLAADIDIGGASAGHVAISPALDIPAMSADTATANLLPSAAAKAALASAKRNAVAYQLKGSLSVGKGESGSPGDFDLNGKGYISPVPGVANTWR